MRIASLVLVSLAAEGAIACTEGTQVPLGEQHATTGGREAITSGGSSGKTSTVASGGSSGKASTVASGGSSGKASTVANGGSSGKTSTVTAAGTAGVAISNAGAAGTTPPTPEHCDGTTGPCAWGIYVKPYLVPCVGMYLQSCMLVSFNSPLEFGYFYGSIESFTFEWGYDFVGAGESYPVANPPADGSSVAYRVYSTQKTPVAVGTEFDLTLAPIIDTTDELGQVVSGTCTSGYTLFSDSHPKALAFDAGMSCASFANALSAGVPAAIRLRFSSPQGPLSVVLLR